MSIHKLRPDDSIPLVELKNEDGVVVWYETVDLDAVLKRQYILSVPGSPDLPFTV